MLLPYLGPCRADIVGRAMGGSIARVRNFVFLCVLWLFFYPLFSITITILRQGYGRGMPRPYELAG